MSSDLISLPPARSWDEPSGACSPPSTGEGIPRRLRPAARQGLSTRGTGKGKRAEARHAEERPRARGSRQLCALLRAETPNFLRHRICPRRSPRPPRGASPAARPARRAPPVCVGEVPPSRPPHSPSPGRGLAPPEFPGGRGAGARPPRPGPAPPPRPHLTAPARLTLPLAPELPEPWKPHTSDFLPPRIVIYFISPRVFAAGGGCGPGPAVPDKRMSVPVYRRAIPLRTTEPTAAAVAFASINKKNQLSAPTCPPNLPEIFPDPI